MSVGGLAPPSRAAMICSIFSGSSAREGRPFGHDASQRPDRPRRVPWSMLVHIAQEHKDREEKLAMRGCVSICSVKDRNAMPCCFRSSEATACPPLGNLIDLDAEQARIEKTIAKTTQEMDRITKRKVRRQCRSGSCRGRAGAPRGAQCTTGDF